MMVGRDPACANQQEGHVENKWYFGTLTNGGHRMKRSKHSRDGGQNEIK